MRFGKVILASLLLGWSPTAAFAAPTGRGGSGFSPATSFVYPIVGTRISSDFGNRRHPVRRVIKHHSGIDLAAPRGAMIRAVASGRVIFADPYAGYGNLVVVDHGHGFTTHYGHCDKIRVRPGERVNAGAIIATVGSTGLSSGAYGGSGTSVMQSGTTCALATCQPA